MNRFLLLFFSALLLTVSGIDTQAKKPTRDQTLRKLKEDNTFVNSPQGQEFWIAIPPNEADDQPIGNTDEIAIEIYVTAWEDTEVTVEYPGTNHKVTKKVEALTITTFSSEEQETSFLWEVRTSEEALDMGVHVYSDEPISVYVLNHRRVTSEGYLALPMSACGTKYMHLAYYDFMENMYGGEYRGSGFIVTAAEDNTQLRINLRGRGAEVGQTLGGHRIGDFWTVNLRKGQVYCVMGDGRTRGQFDLSGSTVTSNKPVGFISFHKRTLIPSYDLYNGRDLLVEMLPPMNAWGKHYTTVEYERNDHGDFFRIIAAEDNTTWSCKYYDPVSQKLLGQYGGTLKKAGDFDEYLEVFVERNSTNNLVSIRGTSVWKADKPVLVMQYSYSADWDNATEFDPFMILVVPEEQFLNKTVFQTPDGRSGFNTNWFNIIAVGDTNDPAQEKLKTIKVDDKPVWNLDASFLFNNIPNTNLFWAKLNMQPGAHKIEGDTKFGGYIYGFSQHDSYGWPAAMAINKLDETDTLKPLIYITGECGEYEIQTTELRNGHEGDNPRQIDLGVSEVELLADSYNFFDPEMPADFRPYPPVYDMTFGLRADDVYQDAKAVFAVVDRAGNINLDSIYYEADSLMLDPEVVSFPNIREDTFAINDVVLKSMSDSSFNITQIYMKKGVAFELLDLPTVPFEIASRDELPFRIKYSPATDPADNDDSLIVYTDCLRWAWPVIGNSVIPKIKVADWNAGNVITGREKCISETGRGLEIHNPGTDTLVITAIKGVQFPFILSDPTNPPLPIKILPGDRVYLTDICFTPDSDGEYSFDITFENNGAGPDSISTWTGSSTSPGPYITGYDWGNRRVLTVNDTVVFIRNAGTSPVRITDVHLDPQSMENFRIDKDNIKPYRPSSSNPINLNPENAPDGTTEIIVPVIFEPRAEGQFSLNIYPDLHPDHQIPSESISNVLQGNGILPKIEVTGWTFDPPIMVNTTHPQTGKVTIKSTSETADLHIKRILWDANSQNPADFAFVTAPPQDFILERGETLELDVTFTPTAVGRRVKTVIVEHDAATGPNPDPTVQTPADVISNAFDRGVETDGHNFGDVLVCDDPEATIPVTNTGSTDPITIDRIDLVSGDIDAFEIGPWPDQIDPGMTADIPVRFLTNKYRIGAFNAVFDVITDIGTVSAELDAVGYNTQVELSMVTLPNMAPGLPTVPPNGKDFPVVVSCNNWHDADITEFTIEIEYRTEWLSFSKMHMGDAIDQNWTVNATEEFASPDQEWTRLVIEGSGPTPLSRNGQLLKPEFLIMLSENGAFNPRYGRVTFGVRDTCVLNTTSPGEIQINACVQDLRNVVLGTQKYALNQISPNPVSGPAFDLNFTLGIKAYTRVEIIDSRGEVVDIPIDGIMDKGNYAQNISTDQFSSGVYTIVLTSGPYKESRRLVIVK